MTLRSKIAAAAVAASLAAAGPAGAQGYFIAPDALEVGKTYVKIDTVNLPADGVIAVYDYSGAEFRALLGTEEVTEGVNTDMRIAFDTPAIGRIALVYYPGALGDPEGATGWMEIDTDDGRILPSAD